MTLLELMQKHAKRTDNGSVADEIRDLTGFDPSTPEFTDLLAAIIKINGNPVGMILDAFMLGAIAAANHRPRVQ